MNHKHISYNMKGCGRAVHQNQDVFRWGRQGKYSIIQNIDLQKLGINLQNCWIML